MRKPQGIGAELKSLADGESGILLNLEFMEGRDAQALKEFCDVYPSSIALTLRAVRHYFGTGITLHADSAFSSVATAKALRSRGIHFMGCVKTACKMFPKRFFQEWSNDEDLIRGSHKTDYGHENDRYDLNIPRPQAIEMFFSCFSNIDVHDHYRQGSLALERNWNTKTWWHRLFATLFGMVCTDAFLAYRLETRNRQMGGEVGLNCYKDFLHRLAYQLIHNGGVQRRLRRRNAAAVDDGEEPPQVTSTLYKKTMQHKFLIIPAISPRIIACFHSESFLHMLDWR